MSDSVVQTGGAARKNQDRKGLFARIALFVRQVIAELKKVVSPTRQELLTYVGVVLVFVVIVMAFVSLVDYLVGLGVFHLLG
ncbi:MAG: preprotein translocase subunit SecE [Promicromonosporaceae bacterium]|nr:preprotein translocase subunit SecE [Promicromonosporaceae bacterium]